MAEQPQGTTGPARAEGSNTMTLPEDARPIGLLPPTFEEDYVDGAVAPFFLSGSYIGERPALPMIDVALSKEKAVPTALLGHVVRGMGAQRGGGRGRGLHPGIRESRADNERKKIYMTATTPDLYATQYAPKISRFLDQLFADANAGKPLMHEYYANTSICTGISTSGPRGRPSRPRCGSSGKLQRCPRLLVPTLDIVHESIMRVRALRQFLQDWIDTRVQAVIDGKVPDPEGLLSTTGSRTAGTGRTSAARTSSSSASITSWRSASGATCSTTPWAWRATHGDPIVRSWFERTMTNGPDQPDSSAFTPLDRFVMELFRTISPNGGSLSTLARRGQLLGRSTPPSSLLTRPRARTRGTGAIRRSSTPIVIRRRRRAKTMTRRNAGRLVLPGAPSPPQPFAVNDGRQAELTNSAFGAVYGVVDGKAYPVCDTAGYAPFGFGYRRCGGEQLTVEFFKELLRTTWNEKFEFITLEVEHPEKLPVGPGIVIEDPIGFTRAK